MSDQESPPPDESQAAEDLPRPEYSMPCTECQSGLMRLHYITYFTWLHEELVTVPNFPAWVCDVCGRREYDSRAVGWLNTLLSPAAGKRRAANHRPRPPRRSPGSLNPH